MDTVEIDQIQRLREFKESCQSRGLYESYASPGDFKDKFYRQLQLKLNDHPLFQVGDENTQKNAKIVGSCIQIPDLSLEARVLLKEAAQDSGGTIIHSRYIGGTEIQTNSKRLISSKERREVAKWENALEQLTSNSFVMDRGGKGEVFEITSLGYQVAEMIEL